MLLAISSYFNSDQEIPQNTAEELSVVFQVAQKHHMTALAAIALQLAGLGDEKYNTALAKAQRKAILQKHEYQIISDVLSKNAIPHLPLKGFCLSELYPYFWLREMSDIDFYIPASNYETLRAIMEENGYLCTLYGQGNEDVYYKKPFFLIEMHRSLFDGERFPNIQSYFKGRTYHTSENNPMQIEMTREESYIYLTAHAYMHYSSAGTGLRTLMDTYLFLKKYAGSLNFDYVQNELKQIGIAEFEQMQRNLALKFLHPDLLNEAEASALDVYIFSGTYGTKSRYFKNKVTRWRNAHPEGTKQQYLKDRLLLTDDMLRFHPFYAKHPSLKPLLGIVRPIKAIITKPKDIFKELSALKKLKK